MMTCERCGTENLDGSRYCDECGAAMWLAGRSGDLTRLPEQKNGSGGNEGPGAPATLVQLMPAGQPPVSALPHSAPPAASPHQTHLALTLSRPPPPRHHY